MDFVVYLRRSNHCTLSKCSQTQRRKHSLFLHLLDVGSVRVQASASPRTDPKQRIVVTGMGIASVFGNDCDVFYDKYATEITVRQSHRELGCSLLIHHVFCWTGCWLA